MTPEFRSIEVNDREVSFPISDHVPRSNVPMSDASCMNTLEYSEELSPVTQVSVLAMQFHLNIPFFWRDGDPGGGGV